MFEFFFYVPTTTKNKSRKLQQGAKFVYPVALCAVLHSTWELLLLYPKCAILNILYDLFKETLYTGKVSVSVFKPKHRWSIMNNLLNVNVIYPFLIYKHDILHVFSVNLF